MNSITQLKMPPPKRKASSRQTAVARKRSPAVSKEKNEQMQLELNGKDSLDDGQDEDNEEPEEQEQEIIASPSIERSKNLHRVCMPTDEYTRTDLMKENEALKIRLQQATCQSKMKRLMNKEDKLLLLRLRRYVKEQLWKKVKFITNNDVLGKALNNCADHFGIEEKERQEWKLCMSREVQQSINSRCNNCVTDLGEAFMSKQQVKSEVAQESN